MMELTAHQSSVGNVLQAGNQLIAQGDLSVEEENEIQEQMTLLNSRWEALRLESMDRQSRLVQLFKICHYLVNNIQITEGMKHRSCFFCIQTFITQGTKNNSFGHHCPFSSSQKRAVTPKNSCSL